MYMTLFLNTTMSSVNTSSVTGINQQSDVEKNYRKSVVSNVGMFNIKGYCCYPCVLNMTAINKD